MSSPLVEEHLRLGPNASSAPGRAAKHVTPGDQSARPVGLYVHFTQAAAAALLGLGRMSRGALLRPPFAGAQSHWCASCGRTSMLSSARAAEMLNLERRHAPPSALAPGSACLAASG